MGEMIISEDEMRIISVGEMGVGVMRMCPKGMRNSLLIFHKSQNKAKCIKKINKYRIIHILYSTCNIQTKLINTI